MKRLLALIFTLLVLTACGADSPKDAYTFTVTVENHTEAAYHGFGLEWYEDGVLVETRTVLEEEFGFVEPENGSSITITRDAPFDSATDYAVRIYLIGSNHAAYAMDTLPISVESGGELVLTATGSEEDGWHIS